MILVWVPLVVFILDRLTKLWVASRMLEGESIPVVPGIFHLTYVLNPGAAFGMLEGSRWFFCWWPCWPWASSGGTGGKY